MHIAGIVKIMAVAIALGVALGGCTGGCSSEEGPRENPVANRLKDPEYRKELNAINAEQRTIMGKIVAVRKAVDDAVQNGVEGEELEKLKADLKAAEEELNESRAKAAAAVRTKLRKTMAEDAVRTKTAK